MSRGRAIYMCALGGILLWLAFGAVVSVSIHGWAPPLWAIERVVKAGFGLGIFTGVVIGAVVRLGGDV